MEQRNIKYKLENALLQCIDKNCNCEGSGVGYHASWCHAEYWIKELNSIDCNRHQLQKK